MEWKEVRLGDIVEIVNGFAFKSKAFTLEGIPVIKIKNIKAGKVILNDLDYISTSDINPKYTKIRSSDILITMTGNRMDGSPETWVGKVSLFRHQGDFYLNQRVSALRLIDDSVDNNFLSYYLSSWQSQLYFALNSNSSGGQANITPAVVQEYRLMVPGLEKQRSIASILSSLDRKIELNNKINADLEEMAQAIFKNWFVDFEPFKDGKFVDSELGMIPEGWKVGGLFDIAEIFDKKRKPLSGNVREKMDKIYPYYGATSCMDYVDDYIFDGIYTLIGEDGSVVKENGLPYMQYVWGKMWVNNHAHILQGKNGYSTEMIHALLSITNIKFLVTGAVQAKLSQGNMQKILVAIPPKNVLDEIRPVIDNLYSKIRSLSDENSRLSLLRDTLLPRLMSGEIEVPE